MEELMFKDFKVEIDEESIISRRIYEIELYSSLFGETISSLSLHKLKAELSRIRYNKYLKQCEDGNTTNTY